MKRSSPEVLIVIATSAVVLSVVAIIFWWRLPGPPILRVTDISNFEYHDELAAVGLDEPSKPGGFRPLAWPGVARTEDDVKALAGSVDLSAAGVATGPYVNMVSIQSSIRAQRGVLNTIAAWSNDRTTLWVLRQRVMVPGGFWRTYGIAQDKTASPNTATFFEVRLDGVSFTGTSGGGSCYACHASGPRAIRPLRADLVTGQTVMSALNEVIAANGLVELHRPPVEPDVDLGPALTASACVECHSAGGERAPLHHVHDDSIRSLVAIGAMPKGDRMTAAQMAELEAWLMAGR